MRTSKVKFISGIEGDGQKWNGTYYHNIELDNGDKINIGKKKQLEVGDEVIYQITGDEGQHEFPKAKPINPDYDGGSKGGGDNLKGIKIGHAITNGVNLFIANGTYGQSDMKDSIKAYSKLVYEISEELNNEL